MASFIRNMTPSGRALVIGVPSVAGMFYMYFAGLQRHQHSKNIADADAPGTIPTWQYRLNQAHAPVEHADNPATLRHELNGGGSGTGVQTETSSPMGGNSSGKPYRSFADSTSAKVLWPAGQQEQAGKEAAGQSDSKAK